MQQQYDPEEDFPQAWKLCAPFILSDDTLISLRNSMARELLNGLGKETQARSSIPCELSYVHRLPTSRERGRYLAMEWWPTHCRIMLVKFSSEKDIYMSSKCVIVPHTVAASRGTVLFNFLAYNIAVFVRAKKVEKDGLPMGIAFAFELHKLALDVGILLGWTKGYGAQAAIGKDVVQLLRNALSAYKDVKINLNAIINVSTGSLMALAWSQPDCRMGLIIGTATNGAYVEQVSECELYEGVSDTPVMIINTEWGNFGANGQLDSIRNDFDKLVDAQSSCPGKKFFDKCISTLYMGELVRLIIIRLMNMGVIFKGHTMEIINIQWKMEMLAIMAIESDPPNVFTKAQEEMDKFRMRNCEERDLAALRFICQMVYTRSAKLAAVGVAVLTNRMNSAKISVAVDGGVYRLFPAYQKIINSYALLLTNPKNQFEIIIAEDSPGVGAAITAGIAAAYQY